ncbi:MAG: hypothetical protein ACSHX7_03170 [Luteolibacter sp.]
METALSLSVLTVTGLLLLKLALNILQPRQYIANQTLADSYMTFERAKAQRIPFENLLDSNSPWPIYPEVLSASVEIGKLPGGLAVDGTVKRFRIADEANYPKDGGTTTYGTVDNNPAAMRIWKVQSVLQYDIGGRTYVKSRTVVRFQ